MVTDLEEMHEEDLMLSTKAAQKELLAKVLTAKDKDCEIEGKPGKDAFCRW